MSFASRHICLFCLGFVVLALAGCTAKPLTLFSSDYALAHMIVKPDAVYVMQKSLGSPSTFVRINQDGTSTEVIRASENLSTGPIADATDLYWLDFHNNVCTKPIQATANVTATCTKQGSVDRFNPVQGYVVLTPKEFHDLLEGTNFDPVVTELIANSSQLYWVVAYPQPNDYLLMGAPAKGGKPKVLARGQFLRNIAADSDSLFWQLFGELRSMPKDASTPPKVLWKGDATANLASDASYLYFGTDLGVTRVRKSDMTASVLDDRGVSQNQTPSSLAIDQSNVYFAVSDKETLLGNYTGTGAIFKIPKEGGRRTKLASCPGRITDLAVNSDQLYWISCSATNGPCQVQTTPAH